mgnify:CR=1 FL=1
MGGGQLDYFSSLVDVLPKESRVAPTDADLDKDPEYVALHERLHEFVPRCGVTFSFQDVSFHRMVKAEGGKGADKDGMRRKDILVNVSGIVRPGVTAPLCVVIPGPPPTAFLSHHHIASPPLWCCSSAPLCSVLCAPCCVPDHGASPVSCATPCCLPRSWT